MKHELKSLKEFNDAFGIPYLETFDLIPKSKYILRHALLAEELSEYLEACENNNLKEVADALGDIVYILAGTILEHGLQNGIEDVFDLIHQSNLSKVCDSEEEASLTCMKYKNGTHPDKEGQVIEAHYTKTKSGYVVLRTSDGKVLKNCNYKPVDLNQYAKNKRSF